MILIELLFSLIVHINVNFDRLIPKIAQISFMCLHPGKLWDRLIALNQRDSHAAEGVLGEGGQDAV